MLKRTLPILISIWAVWVQLSLPAVAGEATANISGMSWGMLPGESLDQLAKLVYPHSPEMQQRFAEASLALNREQLPELDPSIPFTQLTVLQIPDLKTLARAAPADRTAPPQLRLSRQPQIAGIHSGAPLDPQLVALGLELTMQIESLETRNQALKQQQSVVSERLDLLEGKVHAMQAVVSEHRPRKPRKILPASTIKHDRPAKSVDAGLLLPGPGVMAGLAGGAAMVFGWWLYRRRRSATAVVAKLVHAAEGSVGVPAHHSAPSSGSQPTVAAPVIQKPVTQPPVDDYLNPSMHVDEIDSIVEEARVYVALGRAEQAMEMLNDYLEAHPRVSVNPWLYLLDLHRAAGRKSEFSALAKRMHQTFNVMAPSWEAAAVAMVVPTTLEEFPHILGKLTANWGKKDCQDYLNGLIQDNRDGERAGFSLEVLEEILLLLAVMDIRDLMH